MRVRMTCVAAALVGLVLLAGCASSSSSGSQAYSGYGTPGAVKPGGSTPLAPGRTAKRGGRVEIVGTLQRDDNGSWIVVDSLPGAASSAHVIGKIVNSSTLTTVDFTKLDNSYVRVTGTAAGGSIATDKADLGVIADTVTALSTK